MNSLDELLERVKAASGGDIHLDAALHRHFGLTGDIDYFTSSLDAALALVERVLPEWRPKIDNRGVLGGREWLATLAWWEKRHFAWGRTAPLAVIGALLSALIARDHIVPKERVPQGDSGRTNQTSRKGRVMPLSEDLKPCPFCGGEAESEWYRDYRHIRSGEVGRSIAVYCTACHADMTICRADVPELSAADIMATLIEAWNTRSEQRSKAEASPEEKDANSPPD